MTETKKFFTGAAQDEISRDRWSRPLILPVGGGKAVPYTRCTTFVNVLEDTTNLTKWKQRQTILGMLARPALTMAAAAAKDDKRRLDAIAEQAMEAAGASDAAALGTAIHKFTEDFDLKEDISSMPPAYKPDIDAYARATSIFEVVAVEQFAIVDELQAAGTMDRLYRYNGRLYVGDVKTGSIEYGIGKIAMQLAVYAHGTGYNHVTGERYSLGNIDQRAGIIVHLPAGTGTCELVWVDLVAGWEAARDLAGPVREWRKRKGLSKPFVPPAEVPGQGALELAPVAAPVAAPAPVAAQPATDVLVQADAVAQAAAWPVTPAPGTAGAPAQNMPGTQAGFNKLAAEVSAAILQAIAGAIDVHTLNVLWELNQTVWGAEHTAAARARKQELGA